MAAHLYDDHLRHFPPLPPSLIIPKQPHLNHGQSRIDDLNDTLLELIFIRIVQWRHLVTCKCVSKRWNSIISNPDFARYLTHKYSPFTLILSNRRTEYDCLISEHPYFQTHKLCLNDIFPTNDPSKDIVAYYNDILVLRYYSQGGFAYYIGNPITKQFIIVAPITPDYPESYMPNIMADVYYRFHSTCKVGLAGVVNGVSTIDDASNSTNNVIGFRIILINKGGYRYENYLTSEIYCSVTGKWRKYYINDLGFEFRSYFSNHPVTSNNRVHWRGKSNKILVIDPFVDDTLWYSVLNLPSEIWEDSVLGSCQNRLRITQLESNKVTPRIKVWEFDDDDLITWGDNIMAKLRLVIKFELKPHIFDQVFCPIEVLFSSFVRLKNEMICCHPNDPDIVYFRYRDKLLQCDFGKRRLRVVRHCTTTWSNRFMLVHPLMAP
ncbi:uncharacterized protein LOC141620846 [Silene latifolia]|uniref:uncharacterized protein LOC141620846 n=1 Tax=Silene latifolia TaxID=37657 RepID=UPI003D77841B